MAALTMTIEHKQPPRFRHEEKQSINQADDLLLAARLRKLFPHDRHAGANGSYRVNSLYFDAPDDSAFRQKIEGVDRREKFRLRYYGDDLRFIRLEKKLKQGGLCAKYAARLTLEQANALLKGEFDFLLRSGDPLLLEFYSKLWGRLLRPRAVVCYDREAFLFAPGNVRVTIDRALHAGLSVGEFLSPTSRRLPTNPGLAVLEIKYDAFLPDLVRLAVQTPNRRAASCSKYALCRRFD